MASDLFELPIHIVIGSTLAFLICTTAIYLYNKKPEFLWYGVYLLAIIIYFSFKSSVTHKLLYPEPNVLTYSIHDASQILFQAAYLLFAIYFLNTQKYYPKLHTFFKVVLGFLGLFITVHVFLYLAGNSRANQIMLLNINRILMIGVFAFNTIYILVNVKTPLVYFILLGSFCFVIGSVLTWFTEDFHFMTYGVGLENIVFAYGLGYKVKQINEERVNAEQEAFQNQMSSLRAQMNPHFIFNSLNSILGFILKGDKKESIRYLSNFSSLLRKVLNTAEQGSISLEQEISLLKL
ncbi:MAG: histidine kinase, partial [Bacteroidota bacterium]